MKLTASTIKALALPAGVTEKTYFDDELRGFGLRLRGAAPRATSCSTTSARRRGA